MNKPVEYLGICPEHFLYSDCCNAKIFKDGTCSNCGNKCKLKQTGVENEKIQCR
jgi:hypothetical protein